MLTRVVAGDAVACDHDVVVVEGGVTRSGVDAPLRGAPDDHDGADGVAAQEQIQLRPAEPARPVLGHDEVLRGRRQVRDEGVPGGARNGVAEGGTATPGLGVHPHVEADLRRRVAAPAGERRVLQVDHQHAGPARVGQQGAQPRAELDVGRHVDAEASERPVRGDEVVLHVHHDEGRVSRIDELVQLGENNLALDLDHRFEPVTAGPLIRDPRRGVRRAAARRSWHRWLHRRGRPRSHPPPAPDRAGPVAPGASPAATATPRHR